MIELAHAHLSLLFGSALMLIGILSSLAASRFGVPILLVFLGIGILAGEDGPGGFPFSDYELTYLAGSAALAIILFDGGLRTRTATVRTVLGPAGILASVGVVVTTVLTGLAAMWLLKLPLVPSLLIGAIVASTDAAVVFFLLRTGGLQLRRKVGATLEVESGTNDPFAVILTVVLVQIALGTTSESWWHIGLSVVETIAIGVTAGILGGFGLVWVLNRITLPTGLHPAFVVTAAVVTFAVAQTLDGSGFMAAYVAGLIVGNRPVRAYGSIIAFHDTATWLCQIILFTLLGLLVTPSKIWPLLAPAIAIALFLMLIGRPVAVFACLSPFRFSRREMAFIAWVGLRGGVSIFLATIPTLARLPQAEVYFNVAFVVVVVSLVVQGWTIGMAARRTGVALRDPAPEVQRIDIDLPGQLDAELVGNVSIKVVDIGRPDAWEVQGRGELALAVLVEQMRREGFELTVGKPQVVTRTIDGKQHEPFEAMTIDCPEEFVGAITQLMAARKGRMEEMTNHAAGWVRMDFIVPSRGLIGFRTDFLTITRGTGIANAVFDGYRPWAGEIRARHTGSLVSDRSGAITPFAMIQLADRGQFFVEPGEDTYEGQVVGINPRAEDLDVNVTREKKLTNMRSSTADVMETLARPLELDLEQAMEFCAADECVEVTPEIVRVRKVDLDATTRARNRSRAKQAAKA